MKDRKAAQLFNAVSRKPNLQSRIDEATGLLLGKPYVENPLGGGPEHKEALRVSFDGFDCVTFIETALALAFSPSERGFIRTLRELRYENGTIDWARRNHYMTSWAMNNQSRGLIVNITRGRESVRRTKTLSLIAELPARKVRFACFPKRVLPRVAERIDTGDIILFASVRKWLDVFHAGMLIKRDERILLRHATRKVGSVVEQPLEEFLKENRMSGFILLRPASDRRSSKKR